MAAAQVHTVEIDDLIKFFARHVSEWNPSKDGVGNKTEDHTAERVNRDSVSHTAAASVEEMLRLLSDDRQDDRREHYVRMARLEHMHDVHHPDPLPPKKTNKRCSLACGSSKAPATCLIAAMATPRIWCASPATSPLPRTRSDPTYDSVTCAGTAGS